MVAAAGVAAPAVRRPHRLRGCGPGGPLASRLPRSRAAAGHPDLWSNTRLAPVCAFVAMMSP